MTGGHATDDGERVLFSSFSRRADDRFAMSETLVRLLDGSSLAEALRPVCDTFAWSANGSEIGISWRDGNGVRGAVSTGVDLVLVGGEDEAAGPRRGVDPAHAESPWERARRTGERFMDLDLGQLDERHRALATAAGLGACWIEPIGSGAGERALITVWTKAGGRPPLNHALAMDIAHPVVELILRWVDQQRQLDHAAFHDALTGAANRKRFFDVLASTGGGGAVLYCDLDRFKPVNDTYGHAVGDELLRAVARRLLETVRATDLVARLSGDELVILTESAGGADTGVATLLGRLREAFATPFELSCGELPIGCSIGHATAEPGDTAADLLARADAAMYQAKDRTNPASR
jgi:diguanylate cyclase (GGDEF)-like protein